MKQIFDEFTAQQKIDLFNKLGISTLQQNESKNNELELLDINPQEYDKMKEVISVIEDLQGYIFDPENTIKNASRDKISLLLKYKTDFAKIFSTKRVAIINNPNLITHPRMQGFFTDINDIKKKLNTYEEKRKNKTEKILGRVGGKQKETNYPDVLQKVITNLEHEINKRIISELYDQIMNYCNDLMNNIDPMKEYKTSVLGYVITIQYKWIEVENNNDPDSIKEEMLKNPQRLDSIKKYLIEKSEFPNIEDVLELRDSSK